MKLQSISLTDNMTSSRLFQRSLYLLAGIIFIGSIYTKSSTANAQVENSGQNCQMEEAEKQKYPQLVQNLFATVCDHKEKELSKRAKEDKFDFLINSKKLNEGYLQIHSEMFTVAEFEKNPFKSIDKIGFTNKGNILVNQIAYFVPKKDASFFQIDSQIDPKYISGCFYTTNLKDNCVDGIKGKALLDKKVKISVPIPGIDNIEENFDMTALFSIFNHESAQWQGMMTGNVATDNSILEASIAMAKNLKLPENIKLDLSKPTFSTNIQIQEGPMALYGSLSINHYYDLGKDDPRLLVVTHQIISIKPSFPQSKFIEETVTGILNSDSFFKKPLKSMLQGKIFHRTCFELGLTLDVIRQYKNYKIN
jgi:hypothetical protein